MQEEEKDIRQFVLLRSCSTDFVLVVYCFETILLIFGSRDFLHECIYTTENYHQFHSRRNYTLKSSAKFHYDELLN